MGGTGGGVAIPGAATGDADDHAIRRGGDPGATAIDHGLVGPNLRGSGVDRDLRRDMPYGAYPHFEFSVPVGTGFRGTVGDAFDRY